MNKNLDTQLEYAIRTHKNVILRGKHGVGKTMRLKKIFEKHKLNAMYLSASTLDPWVDFIGIPKEKTDKNGNAFLEIVPPKALANNDVDVIFIDEFNRGPKKIRNAVMELIQFKTINGRHFPNLKYVWAAINPADEDKTYDVEQLDPAQLDRFHFIIDVPYAVDYEYFAQKFGPEIATASKEWWMNLDAKQKNDVSPRRLDYALEVYTDGGDMDYVLPQNVNTSQLLHAIEKGSPVAQLKRLVEAADKDKAKKFIRVENNYNACLDQILKNDTYKKFFLPLLESEKQMALLENDENLQNQVFENADEYHDLMVDMAKIQEGPLSARAECLLDEREPLAQNPTTPIGSIFTNVSQFYIYLNPEQTRDAFNKFLGGLKDTDFDTAKARKTLGKDLVEKIPLDLDEALADKAETVYNRLLEAMSDKEIQAVEHLVKTHNFLLLYRMLNQETKETDNLSKTPDKTLEICRKVRSLGGGFICKAAQNQKDEPYVAPLKETEKK